jgi:hypothetical protein
MRRPIATIAYAGGDLQRCRSFVACAFLWYSERQVVLDTFMTRSDRYG